MTFSQPLGPALLALCGFVAGAAAEFWRHRRQAKARRRIPRHWPLDPRRMVNSAEWKTWRWLLGVFPDEHVMVKVPVTRFTLPQRGQNSQHWYELLNGVYCTFTICSSDGRVMGCIDVAGPKGIPKQNRQLKLTLLSQCGIAYWVVQRGKLPDPNELRLDLLGDLPSRPSERHETQAELDAAKRRLRLVVDRQRHQRHGSGSAARDGLDSTPGDSTESRFAPGPWRQPNSFLAPLDSRPARLS